MSTTDIGVRKMGTKNPTYAELLERHERQTKKQAERSKKFLEKKAAAGMKRIQLWVPEEVTQQLNDNKVIGLMVINKRCDEKYLRYLWVEDMQNIPKLSLPIKKENING